MELSLDQIIEELELHLEAYEALECEDELDEIEIELDSWYIED